MTNLFDKLNLRPFERRLVVGIAIVLFVAVQLLYVWPHFGDLQKMKVRHKKAADEMQHRQTEIAQTNKFYAELRQLEGEGLAVPPEDQVVELMRNIQSQSAQAGVSITANSRPVTRTNQFFLEQSQQITTVSDEAALVNFLYNLGSGSSLIRVRDLTVRPDQSRTRLNATVRLVASYQKRPTVRPPAGTSKTPAAAPGRAAKPAPQPGTVNPAPPAPSPSTRK